MPGALSRFSHLVDAIRDRLRPIWITLPLLALAGWLFAQQIATLSFPIIGEHSWRQSDVYSVAYNFAHESADFFHPRIDWARNRSGVMGMEPPILGYLAQLGMRAFGDDPAVARTTAWLLCALGLAGFALGAGRLLSAQFAVLLLASLALSPLALFELRQIQPDGPMTMLAAAAAVSFAQAARDGSRRSYAAALCVYSIAVLLKGPAIVLAPAMLAFTLASGPVTLRRVVRNALPLLVPCALFAAWQSWAMHLNQVYNANKVYFAMVPNPEKMSADVTNLEALRHIFGFLYPTYVSNWTLFPVALAGLVAGSAAEQRRLSLAFALWLLLVSGFLVFFSSRLGHHWYYADLALPPIAYFSAHGLATVCGLFTPGPAPAWRTGLGVFALLALASAPLISGVGMWPPQLAAWLGPPAANWLTLRHCAWLLALLVLSALVTRSPTRTRTGLAVVAFAAAALFGVSRGAGDAAAMLAQRSRAAEARTYRERHLVPLRAAVDRFSTRDDRVVTNRQDPTTLHEVMRKGYAVPPQQLRKGKLAWFKRKKAKLYIHFGSRKTLPPELQGKNPSYPLLHATRDFRIYCLQAECPIQPTRPGG